MPLIKANGVDLNFELTGPAGAPVIAFSHSIGSSLEMWEWTIADFVGPYRCLRYDTRGHGRSETLDRPTTIDDLADDLAGLLNGLGIARADIVGLSLGGMTGQAFALRHPGKLGRLVLVATSAEMPRQDWLDRQASVRRDGLDQWVDVVMSPRWFTPSFAAANPGIIAQFRRHFLATDRVGYAASAGVIADLGLRERIGAIGAPTLIIAAADDPATPVAMAEDIRGRIPDAEMLVVPRAAHMVVVEQAALVNLRIAEFLGREARTGSAGPGPVSFDDGLANRRAVLGDAYVDNALKIAGRFGADWQDFVTRIAWGEIWGDPRLPWKTRSLIALAIMIALHREEEFKLHLRPALGNGVSRDELAALFEQAAVYAGIPASNAAFRWAREALGAELE